MHHSNSTHDSRFGVRLLMARLEGKVALITGAASGLGEGAAKRFSDEGACVVVADIQKEKGRALVQALGDCARFVTCDVTEEADIAAAVDFAMSEFGQLDCMINNAGVVGAVGSIVETRVEAYDRTMAILSRGVFLGIKHAGRVMLPRKTGSIVSLASTAGILGGQGPHVYTMAKHGVVGITRSAASEFSPHGVRVNAVAPAGIVTPMIGDVVAGNPEALDAARQVIAQSSPLGIAAMPIDIANAMLYLCSDEARYVTGHTLAVDAGITTGPAPPPFHSADPEVMLEAGRRAHPGSQN